MSDQIYREIILEHYKNPQNYGVLEGADIDVIEFNPLCGDEIHLTARIKDKTITAIRFESQGCAVSKASASLFTEEIKGMPVNEIRKIAPSDVLKLLEVSLTPARIKCALLVQKALKKGLTELK